MDLTNLTMNKLTKLFLSFTVLGTAVSAQHSHNHKPCLTAEHYEEYLEQHPERREAEMFARSRIFEQAKGVSRKNQTTRVVPVVFHIIHDGITGNISKEQIDDQLRILNEDFARTNPDASDTPAEFATVAASANIEFRLANFDPNGNCTQGVTRTESTLSYDARNNVKSLIRWDTDRYLNIWVVNSIEGGDENSIVLGFAQFPWWGSASTDGIVMRNDVVGSIGTATSSSIGRSSSGRTLTHEVGHYLGLRHIWGDSFCGNDNVDDTPSATEANSGCPSFPYNVGSCSNNGEHGEMYMNYMDYTNGTCQNMFSQGQCDVMNTVLDDWRTTLSSSSNLTRTGTDGSVYDVCVPIADFNTTQYMVCQGDEIQFEDQSWNGQPEAYDWTFEGGLPSTSTVSDPVIAFLNEGSYDISLSVSNSSGSDVKSKNNFIYVSPREAKYASWQYLDDFENEEKVIADYIFSSDNNNSWEFSTEAGYNSNSSLRLGNNTGNPFGSVDYFITPSFDPTSMASNAPRLFFDLAYRRRDTESNDELRIYASNNCGKTWSFIYAKSGEDIESASMSPLTFIPSNDEWRSEFAILGSFRNSENLRLKFEFTSRGGNDVWIDNVNVGDVSSISATPDKVDFEVYPNPAFSQFNVQMNLQQAGDLSIDLFDLKGSLLKTLLNENVSAGEFNLNYTVSDLDKGVYFMRLTHNGVSSIKKLVVQ